MYDFTYPDYKPMVFYSAPLLCLREGHFSNRSPGLMLRKNRYCWRSSRCDCDFLHNVLLLQLWFFSTNLYRHSLLFHGILKFKILHKKMKNVWNLTLLVDTSSPNDPKMTLAIRVILGSFGELVSKWHVTGKRLIIQWSGVEFGHGVVCGVLSAFVSKLVWWEHMCNAAIKV